VPKRMRRDRVACGHSVGSGRGGARLVRFGGITLLATLATDAVCSRTREMVSVCMTAVSGALLVAAAMACYHAMSAWAS
jgi:hypothetical protein